MLHKAKDTMFEAKALHKTWTLAMNYACHIMNVLVSLLTGKTPCERFFGIKPNVNKPTKFSKIKEVHISKEKSTQAE